MNVSYDTSAPRHLHNEVKHIPLFLDFYESEHDMAKIEYDTVDDAKRGATNICMYMSRNGIYDVRQSRRGNVLYLSRVKRNDGKEANTGYAKNMGRAEISHEYIRWFKAEWERWRGVVKRSGVDLSKCVIVHGGGERNLDHDKNMA